MIVLTIVVWMRCRLGLISRKLMWGALAFLWLPTLVAIGSELWWMFVEEPARIRAGKPLD